MRFCGVCGASMAESVDPELRQLTIVFCDLVGSTELSTRLDPEDLHTTMLAFHALCERTIVDAGGHVLRFVGDGVLACFGAPVALDDAPTRAVRAAFDLVTATPNIVTLEGEPIMSRAGVHTGLVVLGSTGSGSAYVALDVIGEGANTAARLQGSAEPGEVIVSGDTAELVSAEVEFTDGVDVELRGIDHPVRVFGVSSIDRDFDQLDHRSRTLEATLVARDAELAILLGRSLLASQRSPQYVVLVGEPGIGKTRLLREFRDSSARPEGSVLVFRGLQDRATTPFAVLAEFVERGAAMSSSLGVSLDDLTGSGPDDGSSVSPETARRRIVERICDNLIAQATDELVILLLDDLQWFDPSTLELLQVLRARAAGVRLAVFASARPEWDPPWPLASDVTSLPLPRLDAHSVSDMLAEFDITDPVLVEQVVERSEGVPLFLEEFVRQHGRGEQTAASEVPRNVVDLLRARLERLEGDIELARHCSVFGREVDVAVAAVALGCNEDELCARLRELVDADVLREVERGRRFMFTHGLLGEVAYGTIVRSQRIRLHRDAAAAIVACGEASARRYGEQLAFHWTQAEEPMQAFRAWKEIAREARRRMALAESLAHYTHAYDVLLGMRQDEARDREEVRLILSMGPVASRVLGGGHERLAELYFRAEELCKAESEPAQRAVVLTGLYSLWLSRPDFSSARSNIQPMLQLTGEIPGMRAQGHFLAGSTLYMCGEFETALSHLETSIAILEEAGGAHWANVRAWALGLIADIAARIDLSDGLARYERAIESLGDGDEAAYDRSWLFLTMSKTFARCGDVARAVEHAEAAAALADRFGLVQIEAQTACLLAWGDALTTTADEPVERLRRSLVALDTCGSRADSSLLQLLLVRVLRDRGLLEEAQSVLDALLAYVQDSGELLHLAEVEVERDVLSAQLDPAP
jgi:class 3 adenylate cyclase/tetratricopeptide (TPR) repeat protein